VKNFGLGLFSQRKGGFIGDSSKRDRMAEPTIVGGRPLANGRPQRSIPRGIEVLVKKASVDPAFRELVLEKRASAVSEIGLDLSAAEIAILNSLPRAQIEQIIDNTTVPDEHRRVFLGKMAAAMLAAVGLGPSGCMTNFGMRPEAPDFDKGKFAAPGIPWGPAPPGDPKASSPRNQNSGGTDGENDR
jgi:hypothetical protein